MMKFIVTADVEVHLLNGDVSTHEVRNVFYPNKTFEEVFGWLDAEACRVMEFVAMRLGGVELDENGKVNGCYFLKKNIVIKPVEE